MRSITREDDSFLSALFHPLQYLVRIGATGIYYLVIGRLNYVRVGFVLDVTSSKWLSVRCIKGGGLSERSLRMNDSLLSASVV